MIPRKIHYCWLSGEEMPATLRRCMETWRQVMPDYELVKWDATRFDIESCEFAAEAFRARKWALAADYIRVHALYTEGGIYLDTDVEVRKRFDQFLGYDVFTAVEYHREVVRRHGTLGLLNADGSSKQPMTRKPGIGIQAAVIGGIQGHPFLKECLDYYRDLHFILPDGSHFDQIISPDIYAMIAERYGFRYQDREQRLEQRMLILPTEIFAGSRRQATARSHAVHYCMGSWRDLPPAGLASACSRLLRAARTALTPGKAAPRRT